MERERDQNRVRMRIQREHEDEVNAEGRRRIIIEDLTRRRKQETEQER